VAPQSMLDDFEHRQWFCCCEKGDRGGEYLHVPPTRRIFLPDELVYEFRHCETEFRKHSLPCYNGILVFLILMPLLIPVDFGSVMC
jgi:hypothetical protein